MEKAPLRRGLFHARTLHALDNRPEPALPGQRTGPLRNGGALNHTESLLSPPRPAASREACRLIVPVGVSGLKRSFDCPRVVAAEEQLPAGGLKYNADVRLCSAAIAPVQCVECAVCNCCCHVGLLSRSVCLYNQHSYADPSQGWGKFAVRVSARIDQGLGIRSRKRNGWARSHRSSGVAGGPSWPGRLT